MLKFDTGQNYDKVLKKRQKINQKLKNHLTNHVILYHVVGTNAK